MHFNHDVLVFGRESGKFNTTMINYDLVADAMFRWHSPTFIYIELTLKPCSNFDRYKNRANFCIRVILNQIFIVREVKLSPLKQAQGGIKGPMF
jgi:hypothetical protein